MAQLAFAALGRSMRRRLNRKRRYLLLALLVPASLYGIWIAATKPSNQRDWIPNLAVMPYAEFRGDAVHIHDIRNTSYTSLESYTPEYYDQTFDLNQLESVWFIVEPFSDWGGAAHTFLSFGFAGQKFVTISVEARKERGESYHFLKGLFRAYELMYVVADERDALRLRVVHRQDDVFLYPIRASRERIRELFVAMLSRANQLRERPEFYNTLTSNCTSNIIDHINTLTPNTIPFGLKSLFPGYSDRLAYDLGLIATDLPFEAARERFRINARVLKYPESPDFSVRIRG